MDLEDWFHLLSHRDIERPEAWDDRPSRIQENTERLLELFGRLRVRATFFSLGWVARRHPALLRSIAARGHELGTHSDVHALVNRMTPNAFREDLRRSRSSIEDAVGLKVLCYRAPGFSITAASTWAFGILRAEGIEYDCSVFPGTHAHGGFSGAPFGGPIRILTEQGELRELPVATTRLLGRHVAVAGGGYFRLLPGIAVRTWAQRSRYLMTYFHPRDFDPGQPVLPGLGVARRLRAYVGLRGALKKLEGLLGLGGFGPVIEVAGRIAWEQTPQIQASQLSAGRLRAPRSRTRETSE